MPRSRRITSYNVCYTKLLRTRTDGGDWIADGFQAGQTINVAGAGGNNGNFVIAAGGASASTLVLESNGAVTAGAATSYNFV